MAAAFSLTKTMYPYCTSVLPPHRGSAVLEMGRNGRTDLPSGSTKRSPPLSWTVFSLGCPLTGHNWAALLIDWTPLQRLLILALLLIGGNVHPNPGPIRNNSRPRYPCSICLLDVGRDFLQCSTCLKWVHFHYSSLTRADFRTIYATGTAVGWRCPACCPQSQTGLPTQTNSPVTTPASPPHGSSTTTWLLSSASPSGPPTLPLLLVLS